MDKESLRFIICGGVDDGKSTLIGRLLYDANLIFEDHLNALYKDSEMLYKDDDAIDFSLLLDGLEDERGQGITIDVAYRFFETEKRKFIAADCPGHEQYTRNMATAASTTDLGIILVDARKGILTQTKRHAYILNMMGIDDYVLCINKMDLVGYDQEVFDRISKEYKLFCDKLGIERLNVIPVSAIKGYNIVKKSKNMSWYSGFSLKEFIETCEIKSNFYDRKPFRLPIQYTIRPTLDFRGFAGLIAQGIVKKGDSVTVLPSNKKTIVKDIVVFNQNLNHAIAGDSITILLEDEIDIAKGDIISDSDHLPLVSNEFLTYIMCLGDGSLIPGRSYLFKFGSKLTSGLISKINHIINVNTLEEYKKNEISINDFGYCRISINASIPFEIYKDNRDLGSFIIIDRISKQTIGIGLIDVGLKGNIVENEHSVTKKYRSGLKNQKPCVVWFTGLSGSGKSTIAKIAEIKLYKINFHTYLLDADNVRQGLSRDLGFSDEDRVENIRRIGEVAKLFLDSGLIVLVAAISPFQIDRDKIRSDFKNDEFIEIFVDTPFKECQKRDPKGLYRKAERGDIKNFSGLSSQYEIPLNPDLHLKTMEKTAEDLAELVLQFILEKQ